MAPNPTNVACRRRPRHVPCPGTIVAAPAEDSDAIVWTCPECGDQGWISGWHGSPWDRLDEAFGEGEDDEPDLGAADFDEVDERPVN